MWRNGEVYKEYCVIIEYQLSVVEMRILKQISGKMRAISVPIRKSEFIQVERMKKQTKDRGRPKITLVEVIKNK